MMMMMNAPMMMSYEKKFLDAPDPADGDAAPAICLELRRQPGKNFIMTLLSSYNKAPISTPFAHP